VGVEGDETRSGQVGEETTHHAEGDGVVATQRDQQVTVQQPVNRFGDT